MVRPSGGGSAAVASNNARKKAAATAASAPAGAPSARKMSFRGHSRLNHWAIALRQPAVRRFYLLPSVQWFIAFLIMGNFLTNVVEKQIDPWNEKYAETWYLIETGWNAIFIVTTN